jgi:Na+/H+-dicarboxylate symporter
MTSGSMLQIIFTAILFGLSMAMLGEKTKKLNNWFNEANEVILKMVTLLMIIAPYGVFCLVAKVFASQGFDAIVPLFKYFFVVLAVLVIHAAIVYPSMLKILSGLSPVIFFKKFKSVMMFAFSTSSSNATIPVTLEKVEHDFGVNNSVASFTVPLGATINMDGTAIMQGVATVFISQAYGIEIPLTGYLLVIMTATLASIGTAGVPGVGLITLAMVLKQAGLPEEGIGLIIGVDRLLDMTRTAVNVTGDAAITCIVAKSENQFDRAVYESPDDGD